MGEYRNCDCCIYRKAVVERDYIKKEIICPPMEEVCNAITKHMHHFKNEEELINKIKTLVRQNADVHVLPLTLTN